ncbi:hypothetical protein [Paludisphaera rhizosphaerae]|uniref:hypothetical protein n=1 Tax=Paludisphaera rhizosphaerae TaxID=2711216 RepID=UPI0013EC55E0|nr:hypothetical protein [Paludisphaera rhizosphaerae]
MLTPKPSRFCVSMFGLMIAVAEIASGFALGRSLSAEFDAGDSLHLFVRSVYLACSIMVVLSVHVVAAWIYESPMPAGRLFRHPGFSGPAIALAVSAAMAALRYTVRDSDFRLVFPAVLWSFAGLTIATFWVITIWAGGWPPSSCSNDRAGRILGFSWIAAALLLILPAFIRG